MRPPIAELRAPNAASEKIDPAPAIALADSAPALRRICRGGPSRRHRGSAPPDPSRLRPMPRRRSFSSQHSAPPVRGGGRQRDLQAPLKTWALLAQLHRAGFACAHHPGGFPSYASGRPADRTSPSRSRRKTARRTGTPTSSPVRKTPRWPGSRPAEPCVK